MDELPVIDVGPLVSTTPDPVALERVAVAIDRACRDVGFFLISGHGVPAGALADLDAAARTFFARPQAEKADIAMARSGKAWRGWFPEGGELTAGRPDHKEGLYFGREIPADDPRVVGGLALHGPNQFPANGAALRPTVLRWIDEMTVLGHGLARGVALGLGLDADWFERELTTDPTVLFRIFRYPPRPEADGWGVAEHTDYGLLTILAHDGTPGLQVRRSGRWFDVPAVPDTFVVNLGDMLDRMTGGRYRSTPHRVRHGLERSSSGDRLSFPFFFDPAWDAEILPVPLGDENPADDAANRWDGVNIHEWSGTYGDYLTAKVAKVFPALGDDVLTQPTCPGRARLEAIGPIPSRSAHRMVVVEQGRY